MFRNTLAAGTKVSFYYYVEVLLFFHFTGEPQLQNAELTEVEGRSDHFTNCPVGSLFLSLDRQISEVNKGQASTSTGGRYEISSQFVTSKVLNCQYLSKVSTSIKIIF